MNRFDSVLQPGSPFRFLLFAACSVYFLAYGLRVPGKMYVAALFLFLGLLGCVREYRTWRKWRASTRIS
jgi:hypothetical protein